MPKALKHGNSRKRKFRTPPSVILSVLLAFCVLLSVADSVFFSRAWQERSIGTAGDASQGNANAYSQIMDYLEGKGALPSEMTVAEQSHMADVRHLVDTGKTIEKTLWIIFLFAAIAYYALAKKRRRTFFTMLRDAAFCVAGIAVLLLVGAFFFDQFFTVFHEALFPQGNWIFSPESMLITLFPESFFQKGLLWILAELLGCALVLYLGALFGRHFAEKA